MRFVYLVSIIYLCDCNATVSKDVRRCRGTISFVSPRERVSQGLNYDPKSTKIPRRFDAREKWPKCSSIFRIFEQGQCGGCWAFASASVLSDRICINSMQKSQEYVSAQDLLECCKKCINNKDACTDGIIEESFAFWKSVGIVTDPDYSEGCKPVSRETLNGMPIKTCREQCTNKKYKKPYEKARMRGSDYFVQKEPLENGLEQIQIELMTYGPVVGVLNSYKEIERVGRNAVITFDKDKIGKSTGVPHAIKLIGWDVTQNGTPVWIIANSWGKEWCDSGFCRIRRGSNDFNLENYPMMGGYPPQQKFLSLSNENLNITKRIDRASARRSVWSLIALVPVSRTEVLGCNGTAIYTNLSMVSVGGMEEIFHDSNITIPQSFDAREKWPKCRELQTVRNQKYCNGCWAFATASTITDRQCIHTNQKYQTQVSVQEMMGCCSYCYPDHVDIHYACDEGYVEYAFHYWYSRGVVSGGDRPNYGCAPVDKEMVYERGIGPNVCQECTNKIFDYDYLKEKKAASEWNKLEAPLRSGLHHIKAEIMLNGPVTGAFDTYSYMKNIRGKEIIKFKKELVLPNEKKKVHAVKIIGWRRLNRVPVWIFANSWGKEWGDNGFGYIIKGFNELNIEYYTMITGKSANFTVVPLKTTTITTTTTRTTTVTEKVRTAKLPDEFLSRSERCLPVKSFAGLTCVLVILNTK